MSQDFGELSQLTSELLKADPSARLVVPIHDTIEVICSVEHARSCFNVLQAWLTAHKLKPGSASLIPLYPASLLPPTFAAGPAAQALATFRG
jgi:hypothetical protein